jgi:hypothetical protein
VDACLYSMRQKKRRREKKILLPPISFSGASTNIIYIILLVHMELQRPLGMSHAHEILPVHTEWTGEKVEEARWQKPPAVTP